MSPRKRPAPPALPLFPPAAAARALVIDSGYSSAYIVHAGREFDPIATFTTLDAARERYPEAPLTDAARARFIREHGGRA